MANGGGKGERGERGDRRTTVSGAIPVVKGKKDGRPTPIEVMRFPWSSPSAPSSPTAVAPPAGGPVRSSGHRKSISTNLFSRLNFLRSGSEEGAVVQTPSGKSKDPASPTKSVFSRKSVEDDDSPLSLEHDDEPSAALQHSKARKRKGSLRKTALLGGKRNISEGRERKGSLSLLSRPSILRTGQHKQTHEVDEEVKSGESGAQQDAKFPPQEKKKASDPLPLSTRRGFTYDNPIAASSSESGWTEAPAVSAARLSLLIEQQYLAPPVTTPQSKVSELGSPVDVKSPTSQTSYTSTTDDDDLLTFSRPAKSYPVPSSGSPSITAASLSSPASSYFPVEPHSTTATRHRSRGSKRSSPLSRNIPVTAYSASAVDQEPHDYTETVYWGWVILFVTWLTFTVGMGSCLGVWSWAWDVGETPSAPPELSDDRTLPFVGYYPALIVLTGVVAWVWITVAWVGMKYFRHAKIEV